jgi:hypothetical protein
MKITNYGWSTRRCRRAREKITSRDQGAGCLSDPTYPDYNATTPVGISVRSRSSTITFG